MRSWRALTWLFSAMLAVRYGPALASSPLLQGDIPGHLETMRWYAEHVWPKPWGWDPRWLLGTPVGILYPPLFHWLGGGLGKLVGVDAAMKLLIFVAVVALPPALAAAARGFGLRAREAALAAAAGLCVLWIPGQGLGGTLRQTFVAGNVANAFALPFFLLLVATLRRGLLRPGRWALPALLLALCLLSHFLVGAVAGITVFGFTLATRRWIRGAAIAGLGLVGAMPFLLPFAVHFRDGSPDVISYAPPPFLAEWIALGALFLLTRRSRVLRPVFWMLLALYLLRAALLVLEEPPFRMEWQRFRLFLYLALVPAGFLALRRLWRPAGWLPVGVLAVLFVFFPYDARGPEPVPLPPDLPDLKGERVLVLASPASQNGSWHGLQFAIPRAMNAQGAKGLFVEAAPFARAVFEVEQALSGEESRPRWWAIRTTPSKVGERVDAWLWSLGIAAVVALDPIHPTRALADSTSSLPPVRIYRIEAPASGGGGWWDSEYRVRFHDGVAVASRSDVAIAASAAGDEVRLDCRDTTTPCEAYLLASASLDWRASGVDTRFRRAEHREIFPSTIPAALESAGDGAYVPHVTFTGATTLSIAPRTEEWTGLLLGALGFAAIGAGGLRARMRR